MTQEPASCSGTNKAEAFVKYSQGQWSKLITLLRGSPQISVSFLLSFIPRYSPSSPAGWSRLVRVLTVIHGHSELRRCPRELYAKAVGRVTVAWACIQPEISSLYGRCVGARCEDTLFSQFSLEMQILFLLIYFSIEREENDPKQLEYFERPSRPSEIKMRWLISVKQHCNETRLQLQFYIWTCACCSLTPDPSWARRSI